MSQAIEAKGDVKFPGKNAYAKPGVKAWAAKAEVGKSLPIQGPMFKWQSNHTTLQSLPKFPP